MNIKLVVTLCMASVTCLGAPPAQAPKRKPSQAEVTSNSFTLSDKHMLVTAVFEEDRNKGTLTASFKGSSKGGSGSQSGPDPVDSPDSRTAKNPVRVCETEHPMKLSGARGIYKNEFFTIKHVVDDEYIVMGNVSENNIDASQAFCGNAAWIDGTYTD